MAVWIFGLLLFQFEKITWSSILQLVKAMQSFKFNAMGFHIETSQNLNNYFGQHFCQIANHIYLEIQ